MTEGHAKEPQINLPSCLCPTTTLSSRTLQRPRSRGEAKNTFCQKYHSATDVKHLRPEYFLKVDRMMLRRIISALAILPQITFCHSVKYFTPEYCLKKYRMLLRRTISALAITAAETSPSSDIAAEIAKCPPILYWDKGSIRTTPNKCARQQRTTRKGHQCMPHEW